MKVFVCTGFTGIQPTGTSAIVVAKTKLDAKRKLRKELRRYGLRDAADEIVVADLIEVDTMKSGAIVLNDGDY